MRRKLNMRNTEKSVNTVSTFDCIARSVFLGLQMLKWLSGLPSLKQGMDLRPQEAAQEAFTFDISMIPFEAALRCAQFNTTVKTNCSSTTMITNNKHQ